MSSYLYLACTCLLQFQNRMALNMYEKLSEETLENLADQIDKILEENYPHEFDVSLAVSQISRFGISYLT